MEILGYILAIFIGLTVGLIGGGGSILCVPVFAYVFNLDVISATTSSMFVVGITSSIGSFKYFKMGNLDFKTGFWFGIPSVVSVIFVRKILIKNMPNIIFQTEYITINKSVFILMLFAILMLFSSYKMIFGKNKSQDKFQDFNEWRLIPIGLVVGFITGLIGAGGGFLIVPALVMILNFDIKKAIGTSLLIITLNSLIGFLVSFNLNPINWNFLIMFSFLSVLGLFIGLQISKKIKSDEFKPIFGWFVLMIGVLIIIKELYFLIIK